MRRLAAILVTLTVAACSPSGKTTDPAAAFKRGRARLKEHLNEIFPGKEHVYITTYDVKKTDSLLEPVVGVIQIREEMKSGGFTDYDLRLAWHDNSWTIRSFNYVISLPRMPDISDLYNPDDYEWVATQACFVSDEAAAAAAKGTPSPTPL